MLSRIRKSRFCKPLAAFLAFNMMVDLTSFNKIFALTSGPSQPEVQSFEPVSTDQMVDPFTGDFTYNIPLLDVGGYPVNIAYHSGITMDQEASWVGLGWNINPGVINRNMRGLPDDFNGDIVSSEFYMKPNSTYGVTGTFGAELFGWDPVNISAGLGINYNNYRGFGYQQILNVEISSGDASKSGMCADLGLTGGSDGLSISGDLTYSNVCKKADKYARKIGVGSSFNSEEGLSEVSFKAKTSQLIKRENGNYKEKALGTVGHSISYVAQTYTPNIEMPFVSTQISFSGKFGGHFFGLDGSYNITGYHNSNQLYKTSDSKKAYGYYYSQNSAGESEGLTDFNREKEGSYKRGMPFLPLAYKTYDMYNVSGQGVGGMFRPFQSSNGMVYDPTIKNFSAGGSAGGEFEGGNLAKSGLDINVNTTVSMSGLWYDKNNLLTQYHYSTNNDPTYEPTYFREFGEMSVDSQPEIAQRMGGRAVATPVIEHQSGFIYKVKPNLYTKGGSVINASNEPVVRTQRARRNQMIIPLTADIASVAGMEKEIHYYNGTSVTTMPRVDGNTRKAHHISEITMLKPDGSRYVYGIPAYNTEQKDVSFNCSSLPVYNNELITFVNGTHNVKENKLGHDEYYKSRTLPPYAHSYLLTDVVSADYVDWDNVDGPSEGDLGTYTHFTYAKIDNYQWKTPYDDVTASDYSSGKRRATRNKNLNTDTEDDMASYVEGSKEVWYLHSIESKTHIALFYTSPRKDAKSADQAQSSLKLDSIVLYALPEYKANINNLANAKPIKTVHFEYDYHLCGQVGNFGRNETDVNKGKLTLKEIYFTYGHSSKSKLNKYTFTYNENTGNENWHNPNYDSRAYDRWGNYMPYNTNVPNNEYPYTDQTNADQYATAWHLIGIGLPSGGEINVDYESDDYAFVMDKKAMVMTNIYSFNSSATVPSSVKYNLFEYSLNNYTFNNYIIFRKSPNLDISRFVNNEKGEQMPWLYFRCKVRIGDPGSSTYENVDGYAKIQSVGNCGESEYGYIELKPVNMNDRENSLDVNPVSKAAWQFGQLNMKRIVENPNSPDGDASLGDVLTQMLSDNIVSQTIKMFKGANRVYLEADRGRDVDLSKSFIRLYDADFSKEGGGSRVKTIRILDNWAEMSTGEATADYGQEYDYTKQIQVAGETNPVTISSGVAAYEPTQGNEENPWRLPQFYTEERKMIFDREFYAEHPLGESFYPTPSVGYSVVTVRNLQRENVTRHATGKTVHEFYTAYDFPVYSEYTDLQHFEKKANPLFRILNFNVKDYCSAAQGFMIETNDMHGKPKSVRVYAEGSSDPVSRMEYYYKTNKENPKRLDNTVKTVNKNGQIVSNEVSYDMDLTIDSRHHQSKTISGALKGNLCSFLMGIFPGIFPTILPGTSTESTSFQTITATKVVNMFAIQDSTVAYDLGSRAATVNELYDAETGDVLLTKTRNEFDDPIYNFTYPAHWAYNQMGPAYKNTGVHFENINFQAGIATITNASNYFVVGDELVAIYWDGLIPKTTRLWVAQVNTGTIKCINKDGSLFTKGGCNIIVTRSGRRNMQTIPVGAVVMAVNPVIGTGTNQTLQIDQSKNILDASATEYSDVWAMPGVSGYCTATDTGCTDCGFTELATLRFLNMLVGHLPTDHYDIPNTYCLYKYERINQISSPLGTIYFNTNSNLWRFYNSSNVLLFDFDQISIVNPQNISINSIVSFDGINNFGNELTTINFSYTLNGQTYTDGILNLRFKDFYIYACIPGNNSAPCAGGGKGDGIVNPFVNGLRGVWRARNAYKYQVNRAQQNSSDEKNTDIRNEGAYLDFTPFWSANNGADWTKNTTDNRWISAATITKYDQDGAEIENCNALGIYSSALFGHNSGLPIAVASNSMYKEMGFDGFEDVQQSVCPVRHFNFDEFAGNVSTENAHTGNYSLKVAQSTTAYMKRCMTPRLNEPTTMNIPYTLADGDFIGLFSPHSGYAQSQKFVLSFWVKVGSQWGGLTSYNNISAAVSAGGSGVALTNERKSKIIDGWQQYFYEFTIPANVTGTFQLTFSNLNTNADAFFDDVRIHPFNANMKSYVYNYLNHRLMAELDDNNYATFYEYDAEGKLIRVKKETERGVYTIQQSINHTKE